MIDTDEFVTDCSYCPADAVYVGNGQDGDFYCEAHKSKAWNGARKMSEDVARS